MAEKRIHHRSPIELAASFGIDEDELSEEAKIINISTGGFCFYSSKEIGTGKKLSLQIEISREEIILLNVQVTWSKIVEEINVYMIGVRILDSQGNDYNKFLNFHAGQVL